MLSIATAWLHETSHEKDGARKPLQIFDYPTQGKSTILWEPIDGKQYVVSFFEFPAIAAERCSLPHDILCCFHETTKDKEGKIKVYSAYIPQYCNINESQIAKWFSMKRGLKCTALMALICFALPEYNKYDGKEAYQRLMHDSETKD